MARITVYVNDALKAQMDPLDDKINWSSVAQAAFQTEIQRYSFTRDINMTTVIERLRASKQQFEADQHGIGKADGTRWAMETAPYDQLKRLESLDFEILELLDDTPFAMHFEKHLNPDFSYQNIGDGFWTKENGYEPPSDEYVRGFVEGAQEVWDEVKDQI